MKRIGYPAVVILIAVASCQPASPLSPSETPLPPTAIPTATATAVPLTPTVPPPGIAGSVRYDGESTGGVLVFATDRLPEPNVAPAPVAIVAFTETSGEFRWDLPPGTYHIIAFLTIDRPPEGPPQADEPVVRCAPIEIVSGETVAVRIVLTDGDIGGQERSCVLTD